MPGRFRLGRSAPSPGSKKNQLRITDGALVREGRFFHVRMGTLVDDPGIRPMFHIFVGSKAPWHEITDLLPQYDELPPDAPA